MTGKENAPAEALEVSEASENLPVPTPEEEHLVYQRVEAAYKDAERKRRKYKKYGPLAILLSAIIFLALIIGLDSKIDFLILWVAAVLYCAALMIRAEYKCHKFRVMLGLTEEDEPDAPAEDGEADPDGQDTAPESTATKEDSK